MRTPEGSAVGTPEGSAVATPEGSAVGTPEGSAVGTPPLHHRQRLKRLDWVFSDRPLYFVTACVEDRRPILANHGVFDTFHEFCVVGLERGFFVGRFVLMPDHLHLFVVMPQEIPHAFTDEGAG
jgi:hypothetical protein